MKINLTKLSLFVLVFFIGTMSGNCQINQKDQNLSKKIKKRSKKSKKVKLSNIDLTHWKVTTPAGSGKKPMNVRYPEILDFATNEALKPYMYNDSARGAIVFYAYPSDATTANTKYSRSELREQMEPGNDNVNWTFAQGGKMKAKIAIDEISRDSKGKYHKVIIMQIHGRLTNEQKELIGAKDNNAPPMLKIYWQNGKIRVKTKVLKNLSISPEFMLHEDAWGNDKGFTFEQEVGFKKFTLEVQVSDGEMVIILNGTEYKVYDDVHIKKWGIFENYFKAGNYFQTRDKGAYSRVRFYELEVKH